MESLNINQPINNSFVIPKEKPHQPNFNLNEEICLIVVGIICILSILTGVLPYESDDTRLIIIKALTSFLFFFK